MRVKTIVKAAAAATAVAGACCAAAACKRALSAARPADGFDVETADVRDSGHEAAWEVREGVYPPACLQGSHRPGDTPFPMPLFGCVPRGRCDKFTVSPRAVELVWYGVAGWQVDSYLDDLDDLRWEVEELCEGWFACKRGCGLGFAGVSSFDFRCFDCEDDGTCAVELCVPLATLRDDGQGSGR